MGTLARVVAPGIPHHVTQRGNRRQQVVFSDEDYATYRARPAEARTQAKDRAGGCEKIGTLSLERQREKHTAIHISVDVSSVSVYFNTHE
jgi:hypothetical protein